MSDEIPASDDRPVVAFGSGRSTGGGWGVPLGGHGWRRGWWRVFEVYPPRERVGRRGTGKYAVAAQGAAWERDLEALARELEAAGFTPHDYYDLCLTLERLDDDQWARVDKRLFAGAGVHTRAGWMLAPVAERWSRWPRLVHREGMLPHEATGLVLGGVWRAPSA